MEKIKSLQGMRYVVLSIVQPKVSRAAGGQTPLGPAAAASVSNDDSAALAKMITNDDDCGNIKAPDTSLDSPADQDLGTDDETRVQQACSPPSSNSSEAGQGSPLPTMVFGQQPSSAVTAAAAAAAASSMMGGNMMYMSHFMNPYLQVWIGFEEKYVPACGV